MLDPEDFTDSRLAAFIDPVIPDQKHHLTNLQLYTMANRNS